MTPAAQRRRFGSIRIPLPPVYPGARIGVMGGTFNPPHEGHVEISRTAMRRLRLDRLWWVVTPGNPLKQNGALPPTQQRIKACRMLISHPRIAVTAFEEKLGSAFTAETLAFLRMRYPSVRFIWVMGADNLASFHRWQRWRAIAQLMPIAVVDRPAWRLKALASPAVHALAKRRTPERDAGSLALRPPAAWTFLTGRLSPLSSTLLRKPA
jgi:nicotinate-nucleotide adenylyltransferase